jgi:hypothetical protein
MVGGGPFSPEGTENTLGREGSAPYGAKHFLTSDRM